MKYRKLGNSGLKVSEISQAEIKERICRSKEIGLPTWNKLRSPVFPPVSLTESGLRPEFWIEAGY